MSRQGNCGDHACVETFFGMPKRERVYSRQYATREDAKRDIFEYTAAFYHRNGRHSTRGNNPVSTELGKVILLSIYHKVLWT